MSQAQVLPGNVPRAPRRLIEWTGERCLPWGDDLAMVYEHYHRYLFAAALAPGKRVLDLASGEGYGAALLASDKPALAETVFAAELKRFPNDPHLEWGLARALAAQGKDDAVPRAAYRAHWKGPRDLTLDDLG